MNCGHPDAKPGDCWECSRIYHDQCVAAHYEERKELLRKEIKKQLRNKK